MQFVTASHNEDVLKKNLLASPIIEKYGVTVMRGYTNVPAAYNAAIVKEGPVCYIHNDVFLPESFEQDLIKGLEMLPDDWEIAGVAGVTLNPGKQIHGYILDRGKVWGRPLDKPVKVDTIDELLIIAREPVTFDEQFPLDFYGTDICMGRNTYVISAFVHHNSSRQFGGRTDSFYESEEKFKVKHWDRLPVASTCTVIYQEC